MPAPFGALACRTKVVRYLKSPTLIAGVILTASAIAMMQPAIQANLQGFPDSSWDVSAPMRVSLLSVGSLIAGVAMIATSAVRLRSRKKSR